MPEKNPAPMEDDRYRLLIDSIKDYAIYMLDPEGYVSSWNPGAQRFKGYMQEEIIGHHFSKFYPDEDKRAGLPAHALEVAATQGKFENEGWRLRKDGTTFWAHVVIDPIRDASGALLGYAKITRDLTERRQFELALKESEKQFKLLVEGVTDYAIYMLNTHGIVTNWNSGAQKIKGYRPDEIIGQHFSRFYTPEDLANGLPAESLKIANAEGRFEKEGWRMRKNGERFWAHVIIDAIRDDQGRLIGYAKVTRDITDRKKAEQELELAREAFFHSQKLESIGQLTGGVAHDFNNLLMAVLSSLELLRKHLPHDPKALRFLDNAVQGAQRGVSLTQRMLAFARRQDLKVEITDVPQLVRNMSDLIERSLGPTANLITRFPSEVSPVNIDPNQLELAILNLVVNARDASPEGRQIVITAEEKITDGGLINTLKPGKYLCISVIDTGSGMNEATLIRAAEPFFTTKGVGKGTGLGLSMVHGFAEQSGGSFQLESTLGEGTKAHLWLPLSTADAQEEMGAEVVDAQDQPRLTAKKLHILAVDDDSLVLMNTVAMLEDLGHHVLEANSGNAALAILLEDEGIDVVITDHAMPHMTGAELARTIRNKWPDKAIIMATGYAELPNSSDMGWPRLAKPFSQKQLAEILLQARS